MTTSPLNFTLGLDLAQNSFHAAVAFSPDQIDHWRKLPNAAFDHAPHSCAGLKALIEWIEKVFPGGRCERVVVESTGPISKFFAAESIRFDALPAVAIVNPARVVHFGRSLGVREKTDEIDACVIALYGVVHRPKATAIRSAAEREIRELNRTREKLVEQRTACSNALKASEFESVAKVWRTRKDDLAEQIEEIEAATDRIIQSDEMCRKQVAALKKIQGIGDVAARTLTAELGDLRKWKRNELVAIAGVYPRRRESGSSVWSPPRMVKGGGKRLRRVLYMCATSIFNSQGPLRDYVDRMLKRAKKKMTVIGALMRKLLMIARAVVLADGKYDPTKICNSGEVFA